MGHLLPYARDTFLFVLMASAICALLCTALSMISGTLIRLISGDGETGQGKIVRSLWTFGIFLIVWSQAIFWFAQLARPISPRSLGTLIVFLALAAASFLFSLWLTRRFSKLARIRIMYAVPAYFGILLILSISISAYVTHTPLRKGPMRGVHANGKVLLLGLDAADWTTLSPLVESGKLPNLSKLIATGASGNLNSIVSNWGALAGDSITFGIESPTIWTSIITGKSPSKHGITDFVFTETPFIEHPFRHRLIPAFVPFRETIEKRLGFRMRVCNRFMRKCKAAWNIFADVGLRAGALGWWDTWPAEAINGDILTDRFANPNPAVLKRWNPTGLVSREAMESLNAELEAMPSTDLKHYTEYPFDNRFREHYKQGSHEHTRNELIDNFLSHLLLDKFRSQLGLNLLQNHKYALMGVYYYSLDVAGHSFTRYRNPESFSGVTEKDVAYFGGIIDKYYAWFDAELGKYLQQVDDDTTVIICSDHGMGPWKAALANKTEQFSGSHRRQGILIMGGKNVQPGVKITGSSVLDILPTVLYLIGMPVAEDMDGKVIKDALKPNFLSTARIQQTTTYETGRYTYQFGPGMGAVHPGDQKEMERLKSLGYLK
jgi:hypothetical protein